PEPPAMTGAVGRNGDAQTPSRVSTEAAQQPRQHQPLETYSRDIADVARQTALASAERRRPREHDEVPGQMARHQPYRRAIRCGGTPAKYSDRHNRLRNGRRR